MAAVAPAAAAAAPAAAAGSSAMDVDTKAAAGSEGIKQYYLQKIEVRVLDI